VRLVRSANLILVNGLTFEGWINELIENSGTSASTVVVTEDIEVLTSQQYKNSADPHAWMTAHNGKIYSQNIKNALQKLDPKHATEYEANYQSYITQLEELDQYISQKIKEIPDTKRILVTSHDAFQYYGRRYGIRLEAIMGISTEAEAQTSDIIRVNRVIKESQIPAIFIETTINPKLIQQLAEDNKISIGGKLYADSIGDKDSPGNSYINMLKYNTDTIVEALKKEKSTEAPMKEKPASKMNYLWVLGGILVASTAFLVIKLNK
jgi:ABC-type Zn uptake system ZnuABC Zn-binding protein ZnuA